jgi:pimeloyl-ACP methyl ester carboxylesterase
MGPRIGSAVRTGKPVPWMARRLALALGLLAAFAVASPLAAASLRGMGVVFLHGKGVWPGAFDGGIPSALEAEGAKVVSPEMPWSLRRMYGATYEQAMAEIDAAVATLKARGATRIVVIGHSLGANAALGYAAQRHSVVAVVALAPGHLPETPEMRSRTQSAIAEARQLVAGGHQEKHTWPDMVQGVPTFATATPAVYLSWFDPNGPAVIPRNVAALNGIPLLWVVGNFDPISSRGPQYAFSRAAKNPANRYVQVLATHLTTSLMARGQVVEWLKSL